MGGLRKETERKIMHNILIHQFKTDGPLKYYKEVVPKFDVKFPQVIQIDASGNVYWKHLDDIEIPNIPNYQPLIEGVETTTIDMFTIISEQQGRIDELTDKLNTVIKFLK
jgi:hypothetical protein